MADITQSYLDSMAARALALIDTARAVVNGVAQDVVISGREQTGSTVRVAVSVHADIGDVIQDVTLYDADGIALAHHVYDMTVDTDYGLMTVISIRVRRDTRAP